eukprot:Colp12_sorted_trinity150504_noHs@33220
MNSAQARISLTNVNADSKKTKQKKAKRPKDLCFGDVIEQGTHGNVVMIGFPHDKGVRRHGGKVGGKFAPSVFRRFLPRCGALQNPEYNVDLQNNVKVSDGGDIDMEIDIEQAHESLRSKIAAVLLEGGLPFIVGGGSDQAYPSSRALYQLPGIRGGVGVLYVSACVAAEPVHEGKAHAGTPVWQLLSDPAFEAMNGRVTCFAAQGALSGQSMSDVVKQKGGNIVWLSTLRKNGANTVANFLQCMDTLGENVIIHVSLEAIKSADAPGVSNPSCVGLTADEMLDMMTMAGRHRRVRLVSVSEFNPQVEDERTGRLVAMMLYRFALGYAMASQAPPPS